MPFSFETGKWYCAKIRRPIVGFEAGREVYFTLFTPMKDFFLVFDGCNTAKAIFLADMKTHVESIKGEDGLPLEIGAGKEPGTECLAGKQEKRMSGKK